MTGVLIALVLAGAAFAAMARLGVARPLWSFVAAGLCLGAAGYAWQGRPGLAAQPAQPQVRATTLDPAAITLRNQLFGRFTADVAYVVASDAMVRTGNKSTAVSVLLSGIRKYPRSFILWTALGTTLTDHDGGIVSPPAAFAFRRALTLAPRHPAPAYYAGISYLGAGDIPRGRALIARAAALSVPGTAYRATIAGQLGVLDQLLAGRGPGARQP